MYKIIREQVQDKVNERGKAPIECTGPPPHVSSHSHLGESLCLFPCALNTRS